MLGGGRQWSIGGRRRGTVMRHEVDDTAVEDGDFTACQLALTAPLAPAA